MSTHLISAMRVDLRQIEAHAHFLVVLTPGLIEPLQDADDPMRREIEHAIAERRSITPILTNGFGLMQTILPNKIAALRHHYGLVMTPETLHDDVVQLNERLCKVHFFGKIVPTPSEDAEIVAERRAEAENQALPSADQLRAEALFNRALGRARQDHAAKRADYDDVLRLNPTHLDARFERALERRRGGDDVGAFEDYSEILRLNPAYYKAFNNRAELYFTRALYERALSDYEQATTLRPDYTMAVVGKTLALHALGRVEAALRLWKPLLADDHRFTDAGWVGREYRLPTAMIDELHRLNTHMHALSHASDN